MTPIHKVRVSGPKLHDLKDVEIDWNADGSVRVTFPTGVGPVDIDLTGSGNFRQAKFTVRRSQDEGRQP